MPMKISFNREACQGHNRCTQLGPMLFDVDAEGYAVLRLENGAELAPELEEQAVLCADNCPEFAIEVRPQTR